MDVILASQSPRRLFLLESAGCRVEVLPSHIDESPKAGESTREMTLRLCKDKAFACAGDGRRAVIAADTLVSIDGEALGQPKDFADAKQMIQKLSGRTHQVFTAVCVRVGEVFETDVVTTEVRFRPIADTELDTYLENNDILDKAGAYAIQGGASSFITAIEGSLDNVIGLPVQVTLGMVARVMNRAGLGTGQERR